MADASSDAAATLLNKWATIAQLTRDANLPGGLHADLVQPDQDAATLENDSVSSPYAKFSVSQGPNSDQYTTTGDYISYQRITFSFWGKSKDSVGDSYAWFRSVFTGRPGFTLSCVGGTFMRWEWLPGGTVDHLANQERGGELYYRLNASVCLWTHRTV